MNVSVFDDELGDHYWCECDEATETLAELLLALRRGDRPWEARVARRLEMKARFEGLVEKAFVWELYDPQPSGFAGESPTVAFAPLKDIAKS